MIINRQRLPSIHTISLGEEGFCYPMERASKIASSGFMGTSSTATASIILRLLRKILFRCGPPSPAGQGFMARILIAYLSVRARIFLPSVLLRHRSKNNYNKPYPAGEGGPQRNAVDRETRKTSDAVAVDEVPIKPL